MDPNVSYRTYQLITAIKESSLYRRYRAAVSALDSFPGVFDSLMELRKKTIELYEQGTEDELVTGSELLAVEYEKLQKIPEVNEFLECEEELARTLKDVSSLVLGSIDMETPDM